MYSLRLNSYESSPGRRDRQSNGDRREVVQYCQVLWILTSLTGEQSGKKRVGREERDGDSPELGKEKKK
jgi:hypothetical protein